MLLCRPEVQKKHHISVGVLFSVQVEVALHRVLWQFSTNERIALVGAIFVPVSLLGLRFISRLLFICWHSSTHEKNRIKGGQAFRCCFHAISSKML